MQTIEVTNCAECPFKQWEHIGRESRFSCGRNDNIHQLSRSEWRPWFFKSVHPMCPLKTNQITVKLAKNG